MTFGEIPPVIDVPSTIPSEETKKEMADYTPSVRNIHLYERTLADVINLREEFRKRVIYLEGMISEDRPFAVKLANLQGRHHESTTQHYVTTVISGIGALGMTVFSKSTEPIPFWSGVTLAAAGIILGLTVKPLSFFIRWVGAKMDQ